MTIKQLTKKISDHFYYKNVRSGKYDALPDDKYIRKNFKHVLGKYPDLENPKTFNEKLQWLKLHDRKPEYVQMVDKYAAKAYVEKRIGGGTQYLHWEYGTLLIKLISMLCRTSSY